MRQIEAKPDLFLGGLPGNVETEQLVLGAVLLDSENNLGPVEAVLRGPGDFSIEIHSRIYRAIIAVRQAGGTPDRVTVYHELQRRGEAESVGGLSYLIGLDDKLGKIYALDDYALIVRNHAILRRTIFACQATIDRRMLQQDPPAEVLEHAERTISHLSEGVSRGSHLRSVGEWFAECGMDRILMPAASAERGIPIPWANVSQLLPDMRAGQLIIAAARPGIGKTALAAQIGANAAQGGHGVALFSLEMSATEILQRLACGRAGVDSHKARQGRLTLHERVDLQAAATALAELPLYIDDQTGATVSAVSAAVRSLHARRRIGLVVIDYLQLMSSPGRRENRNIEVSEISRGLKKLAREAKIPVLACSQINRDSERQGRRPTLADLRDSGSIEQDADVVLFLHQPKPDVDSPAVETEVLISKHRGGPLGKRMLVFNRALTLFREMTT